MSTPLPQLVSELDPTRTILLSGSGSSIPSGGPSVATLVKAYANEFNLPEEGFSLSEITQLAETKTKSRRKVIELLRKHCNTLKPTGGLRNLPYYNWKGIYTTNYDTLVEQCYELHRKTARIYSSDFDFTADSKAYDVNLFKIHGTIEKDECDGHLSRIILTDTDYTKTSDYRDQIWDRMRVDLTATDLVIIGHSLGDTHIKDLVTRALALNAKAGGSGRVWLLIYTEDENRAALYEQQGLSVCFGGIDQFFAALAKSGSQLPVSSKGSEDPLDAVPALRPLVVDVEHATNAISPDFSSMFAGWPASYPDVHAGYTFRRTVSEEILEYLRGEYSLCATIIGASGVGKTTAAKQVLVSLKANGWRCWEHISAENLDARLWERVAERLRDSGEVGVLFIDDAHGHMQGTNDLIDALAISNNAHLKVLLTTTRNHWMPRIKTVNLFRHGQTFGMSLLTDREIELLLDLVERVPAVKRLVEADFIGFDRSARRRRLVVRSQKDMFVCLKNIFATDSFDTIILRDYATLAPELQEIFRHVAAMEASGIQVHRQLVIRILNIGAQNIGGILNGLADIIHEREHSSRLGIFGWRCRHQVIAAIITKYKFNDLNRLVKLFDDVIDNINPTYDLEIRSLRELCNTDTGIPKIPDLHTQNRLLAKMISRAPGERVPRHRLIRNLIDLRSFNNAQTEIRLFEKDFGKEGPVHRYSIKLLVARAIHTDGLMNEDRIAMLEEAYELAVRGANRFASNKHILKAFGELGVEYYKLTGSLSYFDEAMALLKVAEETLGDPQITAIISSFTRRLAGNWTDQTSDGLDDEIPEFDAA